MLYEDRSSDQESRHESSDTLRCRWAARMDCSLHDDGMHSARMHQWLDEQLTLQAPALRFARYPLTAALGHFEDPALAIRETYCADQQVEVVQRPTGGGSLYLDATQLSWTLALPMTQAGQGALASLLRRHGNAVVQALDELGIPAVFRFPNDIEVNDRKIGAGFIGEVNGAWLIQGSLLVLPPDAETMLKILRVPTEKLSAQGVFSARQRMICLEECLGGDVDWDWTRVVLAEALAEAFDLRLREVATTPLAQEKNTPQREIVENEFSAWTERLPRTSLPTGRIMKAFCTTPGGTLYLSIKLGPGGRIQQASFTGTVQVSPGTFFSRLESSLIGIPRDKAPIALESELEFQSEADLLGFTFDDVRGLLRRVLARREMSDTLGLSSAQVNSLIVHDPVGNLSADEILARATVMLVPYCAKLADCKFRHRDGCSECGQCEVGDAYKMARERGMRVVTITRFEHLQGTLAEMARDEVPAYVGMCCESFYLKRHYAFDAAGIPAVLTDISGATCYDLRQEDLAYAGQFRAEARLQVGLVEKVMHFVPPVPTNRSG